MADTSELQVEKNLHLHAPAIVENAYKRDPVDKNV
jgi:hypothetical protein